VGNRMSRIRIYGDTSGYIDVKAPDVSTNTEITIPEGGFASQQSVNEVEAIAILGL